MFQGKYEHTLDDKGRLQVPSPFRRKLVATEPMSGAADASSGEADASEPMLMVTISDQCLAAYPVTEWTLKLSQLAKLNQFDPKVMAFKRIFVGCAQECPIDKAGRILLPESLRRDARIGRDAVIVGQLEKIEIWGAERWQASFNQLTDQVGAI